MLKHWIRKANKNEINYFEKKLYPLQDDIFNLIRNDCFYLSGGTCLSRFYFHHRYSEDIDFFFDGFSYQKEEFGIVFREIVNRISEYFKIEISMDSDFFKRGFVYKKDIALKLEFIFENYKSIGERRKENDILIDSKENIATNKLTAVYDRKTVKDFVDLYYLLQEIDFEQIVRWAEYKIVPLDYEGVILAMAEQNLEGIALMKQDISINDLHNFIENLIHRMIAYAKKHE